MAKQSGSQQARRRAPQSADERAHGRKTMLAFGALALLFAAFVGFQLLNQNNGGIGDGQSNAIPSNSASTNVASLANENNVAGLRAAEMGQLGTVSFVWFHADW